MKSQLKLIIAIALPLIVWLIPASWIPIEGISVLGHRTLAIFVFAVAFWILEPIAIWATSVMITVLLLLTCSTSAFDPFKNVPEGTELISYKALMATFAHPIILGARQV